LETLKERQKEINRTRVINIYKNVFYVYLFKKRKMEVVWYVILFVLLGTYLLLDGYDLGTGVVYLFFADTIEEKKKTIKSIRSVWDANEVWLFAFMTILYLVFPKFAYLIFDSFGGYILLFILFLLLKTLAFNLMLTFKDKKIKDVFGFFYGFFNMMMIIFIALILANILRGIYPDAENQLGFVSDGFSPFTAHQGIFDWFTILVTAIIFITILIHGMGWVILKNTGAFNRKLKIKIQRLSIFLLVLSIIFIVLWYYLHHGIYTNYFKYPFLFVFPFLYFSGLFGLMAIRTYQEENKGFLLSTNLIIFGLLSVFSATFPRLSLSLTDEQITIYNTEFYDPEKFYFQGWVIAIGLLLLIYSIIIHKYNKGNVAE